ncbi:MAG: peroxiredoxin family protein [Mangrovibacterium sp.]
MKQFALHFLSLVSFFCVQAQTRPVILKGKAPEYAGRKIELKYQAEPVTGNAATVATISFLPDGSFESSVLINRTSYIFATFDRWKAEIYLEPGSSYELVFPPYQALRESEKQNPYFRPEPIVFGLKNPSKTELNLQIDAFEQAYQQEENRYFDRIFKDKSTTAADSVITRLNKQFPADEQSFFGQYKFYRLAAVRFAQRPEHNNSFIRQYLDRQPIPLDLPGWQHLFEQQFTNFFFNESNRVGGDVFRSLVGTANLSGIEQYLQKEKRWSSPLGHMVILKSINDAYYQARFNPKTMLALLHKIGQSNWPDHEKKIAKSLKEKLLYLTAGTAAPELTAQTIEGENFDLKNLHGKLVYLHFTTVTNPICRQHLDELKKDAQNLPGKVELVNLIPENNAAKRELILQQNWPGTFVVVDDSDLERYRVKAFPTAFLVAENGNLLLAPALNPIDGFPKQLSELLQQRRTEQLRHQPK